MASEDKGVALRRLKRSVSAAGRLLAIVVLLRGAIAGEGLWLWASLPVLLVVWLHVALRNWLLQRNMRGLHRLTAESDDGEGVGDLPGVTIVAPARNEEAGIETAVRSLAALDYPALEILVVNDHSTDRTGEILRRLREEFPKIQVIEVPPLQEGWGGKANAIWQAAQEGDPGSKWLLLTDADVVFHAKALRRAVAYAEREAVDFCTCIPVIDNGSLAEELVLPHKWAAVMMSAHYDRLGTPAVCGIGVGAFMLVRRDVYLGTGGHSAFVGQEPEDSLLARTIKKHGKKMAVVWTRDLLSVRVYRGLSEVLDGSTRKSRIVFDDSPLALASQAFRWILTMVLPLPLAIIAVAHQTKCGFSVALSSFGLVGLAAYYSGVRNYQLARAFCRIHASVPWLVPLAGLLKIWIEVKAMGQVVFRRGLTWRGRELGGHRVNG